MLQKLNKFDSLSVLENLQKNTQSIKPNFEQECSCSFVYFSLAQKIDLNFFIMTETKFGRNFN